MEQRWRDRARTRRGIVTAALVLAACAAADGDGQEAAASAGARPSTGQSRESGARRSPRPPIDRAWVIFGADTVVAEVARTPEQREKGLMYREELDDEEGMLFVFPDSQIRSFWMANTYIPLDIAYMDASYRIVDIEQMEPLTTSTYPSDAPAMFALEVNQGWFAEREIEVGAVAEVVYGAQVGG